MTYWLVNAWFLAAVAAVAAVSYATGRSPVWRAVVGALVIVGVLTAVFDNVIIGLGIVDYDPEKISGLKVGLAPIEDFAYTVAAAVLIPTLWSVFRGKRDS